MLDKVKEKIISEKEDKTSFIEHYDKYVCDIQDEIVKNEIETTTKKLKSDIIEIQKQMNDDFEELKND